MSAKDANPVFDQAKAEAFAGALLTTLNQGALCLMISVGHRTGLFDSMSQMAPATSSAIAARAGLNERYVREWLGAMVTARVIDVNPATPEFSLPAEHAAFLTRAAAADNLAVFAQYIPVLGAVEDDIVDCFRKGGGVPYSRFNRFHEVMAEDSGQSVLSSLESHILPLVPGLHDRLVKGIRMLDVGCGRGRVINRLASLYPASRFVGMDLSREAIAYAQQDAASAGRGNVDGEPIQGSLAQFVARQVDLLRPRRVFLGHHDDWLPGFSRAIDVKPIREAIARARPGTELVETGYGAAFPLFE